MKTNATASLHSTVEKQEESTRCSQARLWTADQETRKSELRSDLSHRNTCTAMSAFLRLKDMEPRGKVTGQRLSATVWEREGIPTPRTNKKGRSWATMTCQDHTGEGFRVHTDWERLHGLPGTSGKVRICTSPNPRLTDHVRQGLCFFYPGFECILCLRASLCHFQAKQRFHRYQKLQHRILGYLSDFHNS